MRLLISSLLLVVFGLALKVEAKGGFFHQTDYHHSHPSESDQKASGCADPCHVGQCHFGHCSFLTAGPIVEIVLVDSLILVPSSAHIAIEAPFLEGPRRPPRI